MQLRVLWQMTQLIMMKPENIRPNMEEQKLDDQTAWVSQTPQPTVTLLLLTQL